MATIAISDLNLAGFDLFTDDESYLSEISVQQLGDVQGGFTPYAIAGAALSGYLLGCLVARL